jgi:putative transcriptional regulator
VHWGGPVQPGAVFLIFAPTEAGPNAEEEGVFSVAEGVTFSRSKDVIQTVAAEAQTRGFLTLGYAGWAAGQLDGEIETGSWIYLEADSDIVFDTPPEELWQRCIDSLGVDPAMIWMQPVSE